MSETINPEIIFIIFIRSFHVTGRSLLQSNIDISGIMNDEDYCFRYGY